MTRRAGLARRKGHYCKGQGQDKAVPRMTGTRQRTKPGGITGIRDRDFKERLLLGSERTSGRIFGATMGLGTVKRAVRISSGLRKTSGGIFWRSQARTKRKKRMHTQ
jgi:hypothetical protein